MLKHTGLIASSVAEGSVDPPDGPAWTYDFTVMPNEGPPSVAGLSYMDGVGMMIYSGYLLSAESWYWTRYTPELPMSEVTDDEVVIAADIVWPNPGGGNPLWLMWGWDWDLNTYAGFEFNGAGGYTGIYHGGGRGPNGTGGFWTSALTPYKFVVKANRATNKVSLYCNDIPVFENADFAAEWGPWWKIHQGNNSEVGIRKLYYGPASAGIPA